LKKKKAHSHDLEANNVKLLVDPIQLNKTPNEKLIELEELAERENRIATKKSTSVLDSENPWMIPESLHKKQSARIGSKMKKQRKKRFK